MASYLFTDGSVMDSRGSLLDQLAQMAPPGLPLPESPGELEDFRAGMIFIFQEASLDQLKAMAVEIEAGAIG